MFAEYIEVANRKRFGKYPDFISKANELIDHIRDNAVWFEPIERIKILPDEDDDKFIELAVEASASYIVTGNTNDFVIKTFRGTKIYTPKEFYEGWTEEKE